RLCIGRYTVPSYSSRAWSSSTTRPSASLAPAPAARSGPSLRHACHSAPPALSTPSALRAKSSLAGGRPASTWLTYEGAKPTAAASFFFAIAPRLRHRGTAAPTAALWGGGGSGPAGGGV